MRKPDFRGMISVGSLSIYSRDGGGPSDSLPCWKILRQTHSTWLHGTPAPRRDSNSSFNLRLPFSSSLSHPSFPFFVSLRLTMEDVLSGFFFQRNQSQSRLDMKWSELQDKIDKMLFLFLSQGGKSKKCGRYKSHAFIWWALGME